MKYEHTHPPFPAFNFPRSTPTYSVSNLIISSSSLFPPHLSSCAFCPPSYKNNPESN